MTAFVILAGGRGTRLGRSKDAHPKALLRTADRPLIEWSVERALEAGARSFAIVTRPDAMDMMRTATERLRKCADIMLVEQPAPVGTMDALQRGIAALSNAAGRLGVLLGDNVPPLQVLSDGISRASPRALFFSRTVDEPGSSMCIVRDPTGAPVALAREHGPPYEICPGLYFYSREIVSWMRTLLRPGDAGEWSLDVVNRDLFARGLVEFLPAREGWVHVNERADLIESERILLEHSPSRAK